MDILKAYKAYVDSGSFLDFRTPKGYRHIGSGFYRSVYLGRDGMVYKVGDDNANQNEYNNYLRLKDLDVRVRNYRVIPVKTEIAWFEGISVVIQDRAVGRIYSKDCWNGRCVCSRVTCHAKIGRDISDALGVDDMHQFNFTYHKGVFYVFDLGGDEEY